MSKSKAKALPELKESKSKSKAYKVAQELSGQQRLILQFIAKSKSPVTRAEIIDLKVEYGKSKKGTSRLVTGDLPGSLKSLGLVSRDVYETEEGGSVVAVVATTLGKKAAKFVA